METPKIIYKDGEVVEINEEDFVKNEIFFIYSFNDYYVGGLHLLKPVKELYLPPVPKIVFGGGNLIIDDIYCNEENRYMNFSEWGINNSFKNIYVNEEMIMLLCFFEMNIHLPEKNSISTLHCLGGSVFDINKLNHDTTAKIFI
jgi:hypothetical protein